MTHAKDKDEWMGVGALDYVPAHKCFSITDADPGYIYPKCLHWRDYSFSFQFKITKDCLGAVVRAVDLSNYVMLQIGTNGIRPHIRVNGGWAAWEYKDVSLGFTNALSLDRWYKCIVTCEKDSISIKLLENKKTLFDRIWSIPKGSVIFNYDQDNKKVGIPFPISLDYGSAGFRDWGHERAFIKDVLIKKG